MKNEDKYSKHRKAFSIPYEAWYADRSVKPFEKESIAIGLFDDHGGTVGEFHLEWNEFGIQLSAFHDSWETLRRMPELIELMAKIDREGKEPTVKEFAERLLELGYTDITKREEGENHIYSGR